MWTSPIFCYAGVPKSTLEMVRKGSVHTIVVESHDIQAYDGLGRNRYDNLVASSVSRTQSGVFDTLLDDGDDLVESSCQRCWQR